MVQAAIVIKLLLFAALIVVPPLIVFSAARAYWFSINNSSAYLLDFSANLIAGTLALGALTVTAGAARALWR